MTTGGTFHYKHTDMEPGTLIQLQGGIREARYSIVLGEMDFLGLPYKGRSHVPEFIKGQLREGAEVEPVEKQVWLTGLQGVIDFATPSTFGYGCLSTDERLANAIEGRRAWTLKQLYDAVANIEDPSELSEKVKDMMGESRPQPGSAVYLVSGNPIAAVRVEPRTDENRVALLYELLRDREPGETRYLHSSKAVEIPEEYVCLVPDEMIIPLEKRMGK